jgi:hypothetical protein
MTCLPSFPRCWPTVPGTLEFWLAFPGHRYSTDSALAAHIAERHEPRNQPDITPIVFDHERALTVRSGSCPEVDRVVDRTVSG